MFASGIHCPQAPVQKTVLLCCAADNGVPEMLTARHQTKIYKDALPNSLPFPRVFEGGGGGVQETWSRHFVISFLRLLSTAGLR